MKVVSIASAIPEYSASSAEIEARLGLESGWIEQRTGVREHPTASGEEATSDLAVRAGEAAIARAGVDRRDVGLVLLATSTPDHLLPPTSPLVAFRLGLQAGAVDLAGACSGFLYALVLGGLWADSSKKAALVIGANILTRRLNPEDAATVALFSDGAGAVVITPSEPSSMLGEFLGSNGSAYESLGIRAGGTREPLTEESLKAGQNLMTMRRGTSLFKQAVHGMANAGKEALKRAGIGASDVAWWIPHQANSRIIRDTGALMGIGPDRTVSVVAEYGNSSAATIPIAMDHALTHGQLKPGEIVLLTAAGAGLITAGVVLRF